MFISEAFKQDTLSNNTKIIPLVIIEKKAWFPAIQGGAPGYWYAKYFGFSTIIFNYKLVEVMEIFILSLY